MFPEEAAAILQEAVAAHGAGDLDAAARGYGRILFAVPDHADARHFFGMLLFHRGRTEEAAAEIRRSLEIAPDNPAALNNLGNILKIGERFEEAAACYRKAIRLAPKDPSPHANLGVVLRSLGDLEGSVRVLEKAVRLAPKKGEAWHNLGVSCVHSGKLKRAAQAFERCVGHRYEGWSRAKWYALVLAELGRTEAAVALLEELRASADEPAEYDHMIRAMRGEQADRAPEEYVRHHFDTFSASFDSALKLVAYRAPELVAQAAADHLDGATGLRVLDLGCGTGLSGEGVRAHAAHLTGIDLSEGMLEKARARGIYDTLAVADLAQFMAAAEPGGVDLAICVDTLVYIGDVTEVFRGIARILAPGALAVISTERLDEPGAGSEGFRLRHSGRFAHGESYLRAAAAAAELDFVEARKDVLRKEMGRPVEGLIFVLRQPGG